jgi:hypothetical protein
MRLTHLATMLVALVYAANTFADCDAFRHLEGKSWVDGD